MAEPSFWKKNGAWLKGNVHTHTTNSDGACTVNDIARQYGQKNYNFVFLTDHGKFTAPEEPYQQPLLIPAEEIIFAYQGHDYHFICLGLEQAWPQQSFHSPMQLMKRARQERVFVILAHPHWGGIPSCFCGYNEDWKYQGMEIYNTASDRGIGRGYTTVHWDDLLDAGHHVLGFAVDDTHNISDIGGGWIMAKTDEISPKAILEAICAGHFYSTQGPEIKSITMAGDKISVACSPCERINFISNPCRGGCLFSSRGPLTGAHWPIPGEIGYVRIEVVDFSGKTAWSNPIVITQH